MQCPETNTEPLTKMKQNHTVFRKGASSRVFFTSMGQSFKRDDCIVSVASQSFFPNAEALPFSLFPGQFAVFGSQASNHNACANDLVARQILSLAQKTGSNESRPNQ